MPRDEGGSYEVLVAMEQHLSRVFVNGYTGEVALPEEMVDVVVIPESACR
ncbi:hypothetical protein [Pyxidicoccus caerfyrddinensis]|nr:hypothetical protein [Pyxidicoccus caerfyrddinensis]